MAGWKELGYVPDSDDEDFDVEGKGDVPESNYEEEQSLNIDGRQSLHDLDDLTTPRHPGSGVESEQFDNSHGPSTPTMQVVKSSIEVLQDQDDSNEDVPDPVQTHPSSVAEKLHAELTKGLATCGDVLSTQPPTSLWDDDSPLSSLPSSPDAFPEPSQSATHPTPVDKRTRSPSLHVRYAQPAPSILDAVVAGRSLRPRALMQVHPYTIEYAKYQQDWKARGMQPTRAVLSEANPRTHRQEETQDTDTFQSSQNVQSSSQQTSSPARVLDVDDGESQSSLPLVRPTKQSPVLHFDDELPDLADIFSGHAKFPQVVPSVNKKRRSEKRRRDSRHKRARLIDRFGVSVSVHEMGRAHDPIFDMPLSPPRSASIPSPVSPATEEAADRRNGSTPGPLPTPVLSSDRQIAKRTIIEVSSSSETDSEPEADSPELPESNEDESQGLLGMKRRIKGVLPASWLKLDARKQNQPPVAQRIALPHGINSPTRGVARHISSGRPLSSHERQIRLFDSDTSAEESDSWPDDDEGQLSNVAQSLHDRVLPINEESFLGDVIEENEVDAMLPPASRISRKKRRPSKKRQQRLEDSWIVGEDSASTISHRKQGGPRDTTKRSSDCKSGLKRRKAKHDTQLLTVLDAPGLSGGKNAPRFLKVAARSHGYSRGHVPQDPRLKFFQLNTTDDTIEINRGLHDWTSGLVSDRRGSGPHATSLARLRQNSRAQLAHLRTGQERTHETVSNLQAHVRELMDSTDRTLRRLQQEFISTTSTASTDQPTHPLAESHRPRQLGAFFSHVNRSGRGTLLNPVITRAAQLEAPYVSLLPPRKTIRASEATQGRLPAPGATQSALQASQWPLSRQTSRVKRKIPPKMAAPTVSDHRPGSTSTQTYSHYGEPEDIEGILTAWMINMDQHVIEESLGTLTSSTVGDYSRSPYVNHGKFATILNSLNVRRDLHSRGSSQLPPILSTTPVLNNIKSCFQHVARTIRLSTVQPRPANQRLSREHVRDIFSRLQGVQDELGMSFWFGEVPYSALIPQAVFDCLAEISNASLEVFNDIDCLEDEALGVFLMDQVLVIAYQLAEITSEAEDEVQLRRSFSLVKSVARLTLKMATVARRHFWQNNVSDPFEGVGRSGIVFAGHDMGDFVLEYHKSSHRNHVTYVVDTIVIMYHLFQRRAIPGLGLDFSSMLYEICHNTLPLRGVEPMLFTVGLLRLVHPLTRLNAYGKLLPQNDGGLNGWDILAPAVSGFMVLVATLDSCSGPSKQTCIKAHEFLIRHCLTFLERWDWNDPDNLLKIIFHLYAERNMRDFLVVRRQGDRRTSLDLSFGLRGGETDFECFLKLITTALEQKRPFLESSDEAIRQSNNNKVQSLVWSLLPNSTPFFNQQLKIQEIDYQSLRNHYDLNLTLYVHAPTKCRPSPRQVSYLIEFSTCPPDIRGLVINVWTDMTQYAMTLPGRIADVDDLLKWGRLMFGYLSEQFKSTDESSMVGVGRVRQETLTLRAEISGSLADLLRGWTTVLDSCPSGLRSSIFPDDFLKEIKALIAIVTTHLNDTKLFAPDHTVTLCDWRLRHEPFVAAMQLLAEFLTRPEFGRKHFGESADGLARDIISTILSSDRGCADHKGETCSHLLGVIAETTQLWFKIACGNIDLDNAWDKYLAPHSSHSFALLANSEQSRQAKVLFMAMIIHHNPLVFRVDRTTFYTVWIEGLVIPQHLMAFEHSLTAEVHRYDMNTSFLGATIHAALIQHPHNSLSLVGGARSVLILERLIQDRLELVKALIGRIRFLQHSPPSDDSQNFAEESLASSDLLRLLKVMTDTMKRSFRALAVERQHAYAVFIWEVVSELQRYAFENYTVDEWFTEQGNGEFPTPSRRFADNFNRPVGAATRELDAHMRSAFRVSLTKAIDNGEAGSWLGEMSEALSCNANHLLATNCQLTVDSRLQIQFMRVVCSAYIEQAFETSDLAGLASIVIRLLINIIDNASLRLDEANDGEMFAQMLVDLLCRLGSLVQRVRKPWQLIILCAELALLCYKRFRCLWASNQSSEIVASLVDLADSAARAVNAVINGEPIRDLEVGPYVAEEGPEEKGIREEERRSLVGLLGGGGEWREGMEETEGQVNRGRLINEWKEVMSDEWGVQDVAILFL